MIKVEINGKTYEYPNGITFAEIAAEHQKDYPYDILLGVESGNLRELHRHLTKPGKVDFLTAKHIAGLDTYKRTVLFLLLKSIHDICPQEKWGEPAVKFSLQNSLFIEMIDGGKFTKKLAERIDAHLKEIVAADLPIRKRSIRLAEAMDLFREKNRRDKTGVFRYRRVSRVNLYELEDYQDYFYGYMLPSTKYAKYYRLDVVRGGLFLTLPTVDAPDQVDPPDHQPKVFNVLKRTSTWAESMNLATIGDLNDAITRGEMQQIVLMQEAAHEGQLSEIAQKIVDERDRKIMRDAYAHILKYHAERPQ